MKYILEDSIERESKLEFLPFDSLMKLIPLINDKNALLIYEFLIKNGVFKLLFEVLSKLTDGWSPFINIEVILSSVIFK